MSAAFVVMGITEEPPTGLPCGKCKKPQPRLEMGMKDGALVVRIAETITSRADLRGLVKLLKMFEPALPAPVRKGAAK